MLVIVGGDDETVDRHASSKPALSSFDQITMIGVIAVGWYWHDEDSQY